LRVSRGLMERYFGNPGIPKRHKMSVFDKDAADSLAESAGSRRKARKLISMNDKVVLITGASAGIGESCAWAFAALNSKLIILGRRSDRLDALKTEIQVEYPAVKVHCVVLDVSDTDACMALPDQLPEDFKDVAVVVNNAGLALGVAKADTNDLAQGWQMMETNVMGVIAMTRAFLPGMKARNAGHIINIGSIAGSMPYTQGSMYCASKHAIAGFTACCQHDLADSPVRMSLISPGLVGNTEFSTVRFSGNKDAAAAVYKDIVALHPDDVADNVVYAATRPAHVTIADMKIFCTNQSGPRDVARVGESLGAK
jgi:3-hydroxy acid dehydrogenase/malonic semialdehyde reductase